MNFLLDLYIKWNTSPGFDFLGLNFHWYGILWGLNFIQGYYVLYFLLKKEGRPVKWTDYAFIAMLLGTLIGARLGHVFFYSWSFYKDNLIEILMVWKGGLASHGAVFGIVLALWIFSIKVSKKSVFWILDRLMIPIAIGCFLIRFGNLINQEIVGLPTEVPWAFIFPKVDYLPRHPSQLYESLSYLMIAVVLFIIYKRNNGFIQQKFFTGFFFTFAFLFRFLLEFTKENQSEFENGMLLNMGQWLSVPFFILGVYWMYSSIIKLKAEKSSNH